MDPSPTPAPAPAAEPKPRRGCLGLFFKSALGCVAFAIGSLIALVLLLPTLCGSLVASMIESGFHEKYRGSLTVGSVDLAWSQPQSVSDIVLRTPEKTEVARASIRLPSLLDLLRSGGSQPRKFQVTLDADLVADDAGVTNLERALEPTGPKVADEKASTQASVNYTSELEGLDLEIVIASQRLSWSDAETRRIGAPFEIRDLTAGLAVRPGQPIAAHAHGTIVSDTPGALSLEATVHDLLRKDQKWPWGRIDVKLSVKGFSSAMLDGVANQHGRLRELLGPRFDLTLDAQGATPEAGDVALALESDAASIHLAGRFEGAAFHLSTAPDQGLTIPLPRSYIETFVTPHLPAGSKLVFGANPDPGSSSAQLWTVRVSKLELPIPDLGARDLKTLAPYLERLACDVVIDLPAGIGFESPAPTAGSGGNSGNATPSLRRTRIGVHVAPNEPVVIGLSAELDMNGKANVGAELTLVDPWKALAAGSLPHADTHVEITDIGTEALDAVVQQGGKLAQALGPKLSVRLRAKDVSTDSGSFALEVGAEHFDLAWSGKLEQGRLRSTGVEALVLRAEPPPGWIDAEIGPHLPPGVQIAVAPGPLKLDVRDVTFILPKGPRAAGDGLGLVRGALAGQLSCDVPALRISNESLRAAKTSIEVGAAHLVLNLSLDGKCALALKSTLDTGRKGSLSAALGVADVWKLAQADGLNNIPPIDAKLVLDGLSTDAIGHFIGRESLASDVLGPSVSMTFDAREATAKSGSMRLDIVAPRLKLGFAGQLAGGELHCAGQEGLDLEASPAGDFIASQLAPFLPSATRILVPDAGRESSAARKPIRLSLRDVLLPLPDFTSNAKLGKAEIVAAMERSSGKLRLEIDRAVYSDPHTQAAKIAVALDALGVSIDLAPKKPLVIALAAAIEAGGKGKLTAEVSVKDPWLALKTEPASLPPFEAKLGIQGLPSAAIDALAGQREMFAKLFGTALELDASASATSLDDGSFRLDVKSPTTSLAASGSLAKGAFVCTGTQGLDLALHLPPGWLEEQISTLLPAGARLSAPSDASPLTLVVRDVRVERPSSSASAKTDDSLRSILMLASKLSLRASLSVPTLTYADAMTDAAKQPISIRDLSAAIDFVPGKLPAATLRAKLDSQTPGEMNVSLRALDPLEKLADEGGLDTFRVAVDIGATHVPTAIVDALAGQNGLLVDALGARLEMSVKSESLSREQGSFVASLSSDQHSMHIVEGHFEHGDLVIDKDGGLVAKVGLTPLVSQRVVGNLLPILFDVQKPEGSEPASFAVDSLRWPKDGDLGKLDAVVRVNLGEVSYRLLPGLESVLGSSPLKTIKLPEVRVPIQRGVASYTGLPIKIGGRDFVFKGTFNLKDQTFNLGTDVPLSILGKNVEKQLDSLRGILGPDTLVPVEIRGTLKNPKVGIANDFLKHVLEDAAKKELPGLLEGLLKKKKKD